MFFFRWKAIYENAHDGLHKSDVNLGCQSPLSVILRDKIIFNFFGTGARCHICEARTHIQEISYFYVFLEKGHFPPKEKISRFREKRNYRKDHVLMQSFWKDHLFRTFEKNIIFPCIFWERSSFFFRPRGKIISSRKTNITFPNSTWKIIFQSDSFGKAIFSGRLFLLSKSF